MVCCPAQNDQFANAARVESAGMGIEAPNGSSLFGWCLGGDQIAGLQVASTTCEVLGDLGQFQCRVRETKALLSSEGGSGRAVELIESVAQHGYAHLKPATQRRSWTRTARTALVVTSTIAALSICGVLIAKQK